MMSVDPGVGNKQYVILASIYILTHCNVDGRSFQEGFFAVIVITHAELGILNR